MAQIAEEDSDIFSIRGAGDLDLSMRLMASTRKVWQKQGIVVFESFYYTLGKFAFVFLTFFLAQYSQFLILNEDDDGRFANEWMYVCIAFNLVLLVDLVLHLVYYGPKTIARLKKMYVWEGILQLTFFICTILYFTYDMDVLNK